MKSYAEPLVFSEAANVVTGKIFEVVAINILALDHDCSSRERSKIFLEIDGVQLGSNNRSGRLLFEQSLQFVDAIGTNLIRGYGHALPRSHGEWFGEYRAIDFPGSVETLFRLFGAS
jgi:hypothetical protein